MERPRAELLQTARFIDIFQLTDAEESALKKRVFAHRGQVDILVHPFFDEELIFDKIYEDTDYKPMRDELLGRSRDPHTRPLIIFEEQKKCVFLSSQIKLDGTFYIVATFPMDPDPYVPNLNASHRKENLTNYRRLAWGLLASLLHNLGTELVIVGGKYMNFDHDLRKNRGRLKNARLEELRAVLEDKSCAAEWVNEYLLPSGCAGHTACELVMQGFDVSLSPISYPDVFSPSNSELSKHLIRQVERIKF